MDLRQKRKIRRDLDALKSRYGGKNNVNTKNKWPMKPRNVAIYVNQITSNRLTLPSFNKTVTSKTITRAPLPRTNTLDDVNKVDKSNPSKNIVTIFSNQSCFWNDKVKDRNMIDRHINNNEEYNTKIEIPLNEKIDIPDIKGPPNVTSFNSFNESYKESASEVSSIEFKYKQKLFNQSFCSSSEIETVYYSYEKFMKELPGYLKEHFPSLIKNDVLNKNIAYLKQKHDANISQKNVVDSINCFDYKTIAKYPKYIGQLKTPQPVDYIQTGYKQENFMQQNQNLVYSTTSSSLSQFGSKETCIFLNTPEYFYFPHKLNQ